MPLTIQPLIDLAFSPDGHWIACCTKEEGEHDVYLMESGGGPLQRLTWLNSVTHIVGWSLDGQYIWFRSTHQQQSSTEVTHGKP